MQYENGGVSISTLSDLTPTSCPCCGRATDMGDMSVGFDYSNGIVFTQEKWVRVPPLLADLLKILMDAWPSPVNRKDLLRLLYGAAYAERIGKGTRVISYISRLRHIIRPFGLDIRARQGRGWRLIGTAGRYPPAVQ